MLPFKEINDAILATLTPREELVVRMYYGLGCQQCTAKEIGAYWNVTANRVHQLLAKAKLKMQARFSTDPPWLRC